MRIAFTANGPGEVAGWVRPLVRALYAHAPETEIHLFLVPDDYATGNEARMAREFFPAVRVYAPRAYIGIALGRKFDGVPASMDVVQYLGGDLMHAARLHKRFGGVASTYKFSKPRYRNVFTRAFAVDEANERELVATGLMRERVERVGNLAIDGALLEAQSAPEPGAPADGILVMPGSRKYEVENLIPFFFTVALRMIRERPGLPIAFGISPFTPLEQVRAAIEAGGIERMFSERGRLVASAAGVFLESQDRRARFPVVRNALAAASQARLALTIPGTKCIELAALGVPAIAITPLNAPEKIAFNGPLTYLDRIPLVGVPLKRAVAVGVSRRFTYHTQPNIDAQESILRELHGALTPGRVARVALDSFVDAAWLQWCGERLRGLYRAHIGAADRMAESLLRLPK
ncbi:MAG: glycosyltransferase family protein [Vulcanimicrobiaceae bacterium]